jgi:hypothetical protein
MSSSTFWTFLTHHFQLPYSQAFRVKWNQLACISPSIDPTTTNNELLIFNAAAVPPTLNQSIPFDYTLPMEAVCYSPLEQLLEINLEDIS